MPSALFKGYGSGYGYREAISRHFFATFLFRKSQWITPRSLPTPGAQPCPIVSPAPPGHGHNRANQDPRHLQLFAESSDLNLSGRKVAGKNQADLAKGHTFFLPCQFPELLIGRVVCPSRRGGGFLWWHILPHTVRPRQALCGSSQGWFPR